MLNEVGCLFAKVGDGDYESVYYCERSIPWNGARRCPNHCGGSQYERDAETMGKVGQIRLMQQFQQQALDARDLADDIASDY